MCLIMVLLLYMGCNHKVCQDYSSVTSELNVCTLFTVDVDNKNKSYVM